MDKLEQLKLGQLVGSKQLKLLSCGLEQFPLEILDLEESLEMLDLSGNRLSTLPNDFKRLKNLKIAFFSNNSFIEFPKVLSLCPKLEMIAFRANQLRLIDEDALSPNIRWLILTNNRLTMIPSSIGRCFRLQKLLLAGNELKELPSSIEQCQNLELIRISANRFEQFPNCLFSLKKLCWLAFAGNPFCENRPISTGHQRIAWNSLEIIENLGEGASGVILKARWKRDETKSEQVAVKIFRSDVTSDGLSADEMRNHLSAGVHENLVRILGQVDDHPENKSAIVLELVSDRAKVLAKPPDFETCSRDVYDSQTTFSFQEIERIASSIASVLDHLHSSSLMHGDLYAHNILIDDEKIFLSDFGAATFYGLSSSLFAENLQRLEVRAFGILLDELLNRRHSNEINDQFVQNLHQLKDDCLQETLLQRPSFKQIRQRIQNISF